jgi:hypothetical protein
LEATASCAIQLLAIDPLQNRREKAQKIYSALDEKYKLGNNSVAIASIDDARGIVQRWTQGMGCNGVMEV